MVPAQKARKILPARGYKTLRIAFFLIAFDHARQFQIARKPGSGGIRRADNQSSLSPAELQDDFGMEDTGCAGSRDGLKPACCFWHCRCPGECMGEHALISQQYIVVTPAAPQPRECEVFIGVKINAESRKDSRMKTAISKALVEFHAASTTFLPCAVSPCSSMR